MAKPTAADVLVDGLIDWGVEIVFGLPGDGINGIIEALRKRQDKIRFIQVRHEEAAAFMACAYAKFTGRLGVCLATSGPGGIHLLNGLYDAKLDGAAGAGHHRPAVPRPDRHLHPAGRRARQAVHGRLRLQRADHGPGACRERGRAGLPHGARPPRRRARHHAGRHAVACRSKPMPRSERNVPHHVSDVMAPTAPGCRARRSSRAAADDPERRQEDRASSPAAARSAPARELAAMAERLAAPVAKALLGKAAVPDDSPYCDRRRRAARHRAVAGGAGRLRHAADRRQLVPLHRVLPEARARRVRCRSTSTPQRIGLRYPVEVGLVGDAGAVLRALLPLPRRTRTTGRSSRTRRAA